MTSEIYNIILIIIFTFLGSFAALNLKRATFHTSIKKLILSKHFFVGIFFYLFASILNIKVLRTLDYSIVLPATSLTYIWTLILSMVLLKEKINRLRVYGVLLILFGVFLIFI